MKAGSESGQGSGPERQYPFAGSARGGHDPNPGQQGPHRTVGGRDLIYPRIVGPGTLRPARRSCDRDFPSGMPLDQSLLCDQRRCEYDHGQDTDERSHFYPPGKEIRWAIHSSDEHPESEIRLPVRGSLRGLVCPAAHPSASSLRTVRQPRTPEHRIRHERLERRTCNSTNEENGSGGSAHGRVRRSDRRPGPAIWRRDG